MDVIAGAAFGIEVDSLKNPDDKFSHHAQSMVDTANSRIGFFSTVTLTFTNANYTCGQVGFESYLVEPTPRARTAQ